MSVRTFNRSFDKLEQLERATSSFNATLSKYDRRPKRATMFSSFSYNEADEHEDC